MSKLADALFAAIRDGDVEGVREVLKSHPETATVRDSLGATPLHYAAEIGNREIVQALLDAGAELNARDLQFDATPAGWAIEYLRQRGALLAMEIEDVVHAIAKRDHELVQRYLQRLPVLRIAADRTGKPLTEHAAASGNPEIIRLFNSNA